MGRGGGEGVTLLVYIGFSVHPTRICADMRSLCGQLLLCSVYNRHIIMFILSARGEGRVGGGGGGGEAENAAKKEFGLHAMRKKKQLTEI